MEPTKFPLSVVDHQLYGNLAKPYLVASFLSMVERYLRHLHDTNPGIKNQQELEAAERFLYCVNNDTAWPIVRRHVSSSLNKITPEEDTVLEYILQSLKDRLAPTPDRREYVPEYQRQLVWRRLKCQIKVIAQKDDETDELVGGLTKIYQDKT